RMNQAGAEAIAVVDGGRLAGIVTTQDILRWVGAGGGSDADGRVAELVHGALVVIPPSASVSQCVLAMTQAGTHAVAVTSDGSQDGKLQHVLTSADLTPA